MRQRLSVIQAPVYLFVLLRLKAYPNRQSLEHIFCESVEKILWVMSNCKLG